MDGIMTREGETICSQWSRHRRDKPVGERVVIAPHASSPLAGSELRVHAEIKLALHQNGIVGCGFLPPCLKFFRYRPLNATTDRPRPAGSGRQSVLDRHLPAGEGTPANGDAVPRMAFCYLMVSDNHSQSAPFRVGSVGGKFLVSGFWFLVSHSGDE